MDAAGGQGEPCPLVLKFWRNQDVWVFCDATVYPVDDVVVAPSGAIRACDRMVHVGVWCPCYVCQQLVFTPNARWTVEQTENTLRCPEKLQFRMLGSVLEITRSIKVPFNICIVRVMSDDDPSCVNIGELLYRHVVYIVIATMVMLGERVEVRSGRVADAIPSSRPVHGRERNSVAVTPYRRLVFAEVDYVSCQRVDPCPGAEMTIIQIVILSRPVATTRFSAPHLAAVWRNTTIYFGIRI